MTASASRELAHGPEWAALELLCHPPNTPGRDEQLQAMVAGRDLHWGELIEQAIRHKLLPLLAGHLTDRRHGDSVPPPLASHLRHVLRANQHRTRIYRTEALRVTTALAEADVPAAVTGALALEATIYAGEGTRTFTDLDLLIPPTQQEHATGTLTRLGYQPETPGTHLRHTEDPITPTLIVDITTSLPPGTSRTEYTQIDPMLHRRSWQPVPGHPAEAGLPVLAATDHALTYLLALFHKATHGNHLTLLALADLLRLWITTPDLRWSATLAASPIWTAARQPTQWGLATLDQIFGTTLLDHTGLTYDPDDRLASTGGNQHAPLPGTVREQLHAKTHPDPPRSATTPAAPA
jgi:Uncharacterised nucleotidyltransferase